jgi:DNA repair exonuclease SbcCD nuclease subunit
MKYGVISDLHCHDWSLFSKVNSDGVNSRLRATLCEVERAAQAVKDAGGTHLVIAGDIFHSRGKMDPEVLNPTREAFERIRELGIEIVAIPGNHDLKSKETNELSSSIQNLRSDKFKIMNNPNVLIGAGWVLGFVPWQETIEGLHAGLKKLAGSPNREKMDVFIHAGIDGVLSGVPGSGLTASDLAAYGFRRIFAGHYHNHKDMGGGVHSIGATTHQNWGDVGTRAGFLMVDDKTVTFHDTMAPKFEDVSGLDELEMELACKGNYVRFRGPAMLQEDINELRKQFQDWGALGISIEVTKITTAHRTTAPATGMTLDQSVDAFVDAKTDFPAHVDAAAVKKRAAEVLAAARAVAE